jgi:phosphoribosylamine---glycine ligase
MRVLLVGGGARENAIGAALVTAGAELRVAAPWANPALTRLANSFQLLDPTHAAEVVEYARRERVDYAVIGPEAALAAGVADALREAEIPVVGPSRNGARIETSKWFCRDLMARYHIPGAPKLVVAATPDEVAGKIAELGVLFVVKPVGLTSGKGVAVQGRDFQTPEEGAAYAKEALAGPAGRNGVLLEERVDGEEFSLMAFVTDSGVFPMPLVQDYKRAGPGDTGPNTGGMGAYSQRDHRLPFVSPSVYDEALDIVRRTAQALRSEGISYRGVLYGGFMMTARGPVLLEFNARFGDPESINVLALYEPGDFDAMLHGIATGHVVPGLVEFRLRATVTRYLVPAGYPANPTPGGILEIDESEIEKLGVHVRYGAVEPAGPGRVRMLTSRALALVGEASAIHEAALRVEAALAYVRGPYEVRHDIGTKEDVAKRTEHVRTLLAPGTKPSPLPLSVLPAAAPPSSAASPEMLLST